MPSVVLVAGDPSGDAHAARLIDALKRRPGPWTFAGLGGPAMAAAGMTLLEDLTAAAAIGPFDAARHVATFRRAKALFAQHLAAQRPDLVVLVDFGDFNLPVMAPLAKHHGVPVLYYISPQLWAWGRWRLRYVRRYVNRMVVFFPFEEAFYRQAGVPVTWVGHPLLDEAPPAGASAPAPAFAGVNPWRRTVGLLPGSREREIARHLPVMLASARRIANRMPGIQVLLPAASASGAQQLRADLAKSGLAGGVFEGPIREAVRLMDAAIVASGTATLDVALGEVPMVVLYRTSWPTYLAARAVLRIPDIALVNVVAGRRIVPELIQHRAHPAAIATEAIRLLRDTEAAEAMRTELRLVREKLGPPGAVERAADAVLALLEK